MTLPAMIPTPASTEPTERCGFYRAWDVADAGAIDRLWHCSVGFAPAAPHWLMPFAEPSLLLRRRFDPAGATLSFGLEIAPASLDGECYRPAAGEALYAVRLAPETMEPLLGLKASEYTSTHRAVPDALRRRLDPVLALASRDRFAEAWAEMARILAGMERGGGPAPVEFAARHLRLASGRLAPGELARLADISPRQLRRGFAERFGRSPRAIARRLRLAGALFEAEVAARPCWAGIAAGHRFSDQAHLVRECRAILGATPTAVHAARRAMAVSFNS